MNRLRARSISMAIAGLMTAPTAQACELALVLAVDVSGSVDRREYRVQMDGLAAALRDGVVTDALIDRKAYVTLFQWTGLSRQQQTIPWTQMLSVSDVEALARRVETDERVWHNYSTAIGEALNVSEQAFDQIEPCRRKVIDLSGDGISNEGIDPGAHKSRFTQSGITVNAIAIETDETDLTAYFFENVIVGDGAFVVTAKGYEKYPEQIKRKLTRETTRQLSDLR